MQDRNGHQTGHTPEHPLRSLTPAQFAALGGNAVVYVRDIQGDALGALLDEPGFIDEETYRLVVSADGTPVFVSDTSEAVDDWLAERNFGIVQLH